MDRTIPSPRKRQRLSSATTASTTTRKTSTSLARSKGPCSSLRTADSTSGPQRSGSSIDGKDRESSSATLDADADAMAILRAHFESRFEPIAANTASSADESHDHDGQTAEYDDDEWEGCSSDNASSEDEQDGEEKRREPVVVVVHHQETTAGHGHLSNLAHEGDGDVDVRISKAEMRAFLSGKLITSNKTAPTMTSQSKRKNAPDSDGTDDITPDNFEALNLKNDLALQRLLRESHLLDSSSASLQATGKNRLKALDSRLDSVGLKPLPGQKHGWHLRKGIDGKKERVEKARRREARENGIVLEKEVKKDTKRVKRTREMGAPGFAPAVGRFKNGALVLSKKDVREIEGRRSSGGKGGKPKGKRRR